VTRDARILLLSRGARAFADGYVAILLPIYLKGLGFAIWQIGVLTTATLAGSAALTLAVGMFGYRYRARDLLLWACALMLATGLAFAGLRQFWPLVVVGFLGTLNPSAGDVSVFLPLEQSLLAHAVTDQERTTVFARYSLSASLMGALGALSVALVEPVGRMAGLPTQDAIAAMFVLYGLLGVAILPLYRQLPREDAAGSVVRTPLGPSRRRVTLLAGLFSLDSFGGGFLVQSLLALWLFERFGLSLHAAAAFFFWAGVLTAFSQLAAPWLARRIGLINTMVFTHIPANLAMVAVAFAPDLPTAIGLLLFRSALSQMDVPARTSYVMAIVTPAERAAAASFTNVPRSLASAAGPSFAGLLLGASAFAWPLVIGGGLKIVYDLLLLAMFRTVRPPEEQGRR
jgi:MFS family permease